MFTLKHIESKFPITIEIVRGSNSLEFNIGSIISKRNKEELNPGQQFALLNAYLDYKGDEFKDKLFGLYVKAEEEIMMSVMNAELHPLPNHIVHNILDMFDMYDVFTYIKSNYGIQAPKSLKDEFNMQIESDGLGTRIQTYTKDDYFELASLTLAVKAVLGPIGQFAFVKNSEINGLHKEYILYTMINSHSIASSAPVIKLKGLSEKLIEMNIREDAVSAVSVIEKQVSRDDMGDHILSIIMLQKVAVADIVTDNENKNIITRMYNYIINKLKVKGDSGNRIKEKQAKSDSEGASGDKESMVETYRVVSDLTKGSEIELDWSVSNIDVIVRELPTEIDREVLKDAVIFTRHMGEQTISRQQIKILGYIFKYIIDPRGLDYVKIDSILNLMAVGFAFLWSRGHREMAILLTSVPDSTNNDNVMSINTTVNRNRLSKELKEELQVLYPYNKRVNADTTTNIVEDTINDISNIMYTKKWIPLASDKYIAEGLEGGSKLNILPPNLKIKLAELIIDTERVINAK